MSKPPPPENHVRKSVTLPQSLWARVSAFRKREYIGSEMETIRRLIKEGLDAAAARKGPAG